MSRTLGVSVDWSVGDILECQSRRPAVIICHQAKHHRKDRTQTIRVCSISCTEREQFSSVHAVFSGERTRDLANGFASLSAAPADFTAETSRRIKTREETSGGGLLIFSHNFSLKNALKTPRGTRQTPLNAFIVKPENVLCGGGKWPPLEVVSTAAAPRKPSATALRANGRLQRCARPTARCPGVNVACLAEPSQTGQAALPESGRGLGPKKKNPTQNTHTSPGLASVICLGRPASAASLL